MLSLPGSRRSCPLDDIRPFLDDEEKCVDLFFSWKYPAGFRCPGLGCDSRTAYRLRRRRVWQCTLCRYQDRLTAGTVLHGSHLPLRHWLYAIWMVAHRKQSISALQLQKELGIGSYETAWSLLHKIRRAICGRTPHHPLSGRVSVSIVELAVPTVRLVGDVDAAKTDVCFGIERGRGYTSAVRALASARSSSLQTASWLGGPLVRLKRKDPLLRRVSRNFVDWLNGTFHGITSKYLDAYLDEFQFRFFYREPQNELPSALGLLLLSSPGVTVRQLRTEPPLR